MKKRNSEWLHWMLLMIPCIYVIVIYKQLPDSIAIHFDMEGKANGFSDKMNLLWMIPLETWGLYFLLRYLPKIDPKKRDADTNPVNTKFRLIFTIFMTALGIFELVAAQKGGLYSSGVNYTMVAVGALLCFVGNYMSTIKPNYFIGVRTPWTLESEYVWKKTNRVLGRITALLGAVMVLASLLNANEIVNKVLIGGIIGVAVISYPYSWYVHKQASRQPQ